jgi:hypothetical protein
MSIANRATVCFAVQLFMAVALAVGLDACACHTASSGQAAASIPELDWRLAYAMPIFVYIALWIEGGAPQTPYHLVVLATFLFHFVRRILEILLSTVTRAPTPLWALLIIALLYSGAAMSCAFFQVHTLGQPTSNPIFILGVLVFAFGELLNGSHHWLLARLRAPGVRTYGVPRGGLFGWVASPHYLGEILSFVGYAVTSDCFQYGATPWSCPPIWPQELARP